MGFVGFALAEGYCKSAEFRPLWQARKGRTWLFTAATALLCALLSTTDNPLFDVPICALLCMLAYIDMRCGLLPNLLLLLLLLLALGEALLSGWQSHLYGLLVGGGAYALFYLLGLALFRREAMGLGDVKLMAVCGFWLGWEKAIPAVLLTPLLAAVVALVLLLARRIRKDSPLPFGPYIVLAALFCQMAAGGWVTDYLEWLGFFTF